MNAHKAFLIQALILPFVSLTSIAQSIKFGAVNTGINVTTPATQTTNTPSGTINTGVNIYNGATGGNQNNTQNSQQNNTPSGSGKSGTNSGNTTTPVTTSPTNTTNQGSGNDKSIGIGNVLGTGMNVLNGGGQGAPSNLDMQNGLRDALSLCLTNGADLVSLKDGYFKNLVIKILFPQEAKQVESTLRNMGLNKICDDAILSFNRAAEDAGTQAKPIFLDAIKQMTITDVSNILLGPDNAATDFFKRTTTAALTTKFKPIVTASLNKVGATKYWKTVMSNYNRLPMVKPVNPDLNEFVTQKAIEGLFVMVAKEEVKVRNDIKTRTTPLIKDVFGWVDSQRKK